ncbi:MAG: hypothetical protein JSR54_12180 [Proteobacteria bacterium]|nr:hypothetical protein [Pseudomonadota bacterium]
MRGSRDDETLLRYDGVPLASPFHLEELQSLFSAIDPQSVETATAWTGIAPIQFGNRIGAVLDFEPRRVVATSLDAALSNQGLSLFAGTPVAGDGGTVFAAFRAQNAVSPAGWVDLDTPVPYLDDLVVRATWTLGERTSLAAGALGIDDRRSAYSNDRTEQVRLESQAAYAWVRIRHDFTSGLTSETLLWTDGASDFTAGTIAVPGVESGTATARDARHSIGAREELTYARSRRWALRLGAELGTVDGDNSAAAQAGYLAPWVPGLQPSATLDQFTAQSVHADSAAGYASLRLEGLPRTIADLGLRYDARRYRAGPSDGVPTARVSVRHEIGTATTLRVGWGQSSQASPTDEISGGGAGGPLAARRLTQTNVSLERAPANTWSLRLEAYRKREGAPVVSYENVFSPLTLVPDIGVDRITVLSQRARMDGIELTAASDRSRPLGVALSYTWSRADDLVGGRWIPRSWDQPHSIQALGLWQSGAWRVSSTASWHRGWPYTPLLAPAQTWSDPGSAAVALGPRNSLRMENVFSLDVRASRIWPLRSGSLEASISLLDATDAHSTCCRQYSVVAQPGGDYRLMSTRSNWLRFMPIVGLRWHH